MTTFKAVNPIVDRLLKTEGIPTDEIIEEILALPRNELINDLENALNFVLADNYAEKLTLLGLHSIFLLTELKSEASLPLLINICKQDDDFLFHYFDEHPTETMWQDTLVLGKDNLTILFEFLKNADASASGTCIITDGLSQIGLISKEYRDKVIAGLNDLLHYLYLHQKDYKFESLNWLMLLITNLKAIELKNILKKFFDDKRMLDYNKWTEVLEDLNNQGEEKRPTLTLKERYKSTSTPDIAFQKELEDIRSIKADTPEEFAALKERTENLFKHKGIDISKGF